MSKPYPSFIPPDFSVAALVAAPVVKTEAALADGVVPENFHGTSNHPEYVHLGAGRWLLAPESRMDSVLVLSGDQHWAGAFRLSETAPLLVHEFMPTPIGVALRDAPSLDHPDVLYADGSYRGFGLFTVDASATPVTIDFEWIDEGGVVRRALHLDAKQPLEGTVKPKVSLSFRKVDRDKLKLTIKQWRLPAAFERDGARIVIDVGGAVLDATLDGKGRFKSEDRRDRVTLKRSRKGWTLVVVRRRLDLQADLADDGLIDETNGKPGKPVGIDVSVAVNGTAYRETIQLSYRSKAGKHGTAKRR